MKATKNPYSAMPLRSIEQALESAEIVRHDAYLMGEFEEAHFLEEEIALLVSARHAAQENVFL